MINNVMEDECTTNEIPLPNVTTRILTHIINYSKAYFEFEIQGDGDAQELPKKWDADFANVDEATPYDLMKPCTRRKMMVSCNGLQLILKDWVHRRRIESKGRI